MSSSESIAMGYEKLMIVTFIICITSVASMAMIGRGQLFNDPYLFWGGIAMFVGGVLGMFGFALYKFILEFNAGFLIHNIMYGGDSKPIQETLYYETIEEITNPTEREDLRKFIKPGEEYLLPMMNSPQFYYTRIKHEHGDRIGQTDYITVLPFTTCIQPFGWRGSWICQEYPRLNPKLSLVYGEFRGTREGVGTIQLNSVQKFLQKLGKHYDTRIVQSIPIYFALGTTMTANYSNLIQKLPHLETSWIEQNARGVQSQDSSDYTTEIDMLYDIIENDKKLLSRKLRPAFYETKIIEREGVRGKVANMTQFQKYIIYLTLGAFVLAGLWIMLSSGQVPQGLEQIEPILPGLQDGA